MRGHVDVTGAGVVDRPEDALAQGLQAVHVNHCCRHRHHDAQHRREEA